MIFRHAPRGCTSESDGARLDGKEISFLPCGARLKRVEIFLTPRDSKLRANLVHRSPTGLKTMKLD